MATTDATGALTGTFTYDPFGNPTNTTSPLTPNNTAAASTFGWAGQHQKLTETSLTLTPIQMGARVYLPQIGRFASVDLVEGGTANNYAYVGDPVNGSDYSGFYACFLQCTVMVSFLQPAATIVRVQATSTAPLQARARRDRPAALTTKKSARGINMDKIPNTGRAGGPTQPSGSRGLFSGLIPPAGYSIGGALKAVGEGCITTGLAFMAAGGAAAPFTGGVSIPSAAMSGCTNGAMGGFVVYMLIGDSGRNDLSIMEDTRSYLDGLRR